MAKLILVYANCLDPTAMGDFSFAALIARDLIQELNSSKVEVILTSTQASINKFERLYGSAENGFISVHGQLIKICALEAIDPVENKVIAFVEANRCKHAPVALVKRIISPNTKFLIIDNANKPELDNRDMVEKYILYINKQQPRLYDYVWYSDIFIGTAGFGTNRLGLTKFNDLAKEPELSSMQKRMIPRNPYGLMYLKNTSDDIALICQYMQLTGFDDYVLVGDFVERAEEIYQSYLTERRSIQSSPKVPKIHYYRSIDNSLMQELHKYSASDLILSTGTMSTIEVMQAKKLVYYQNMSINEHFVFSYLVALESILQNENNVHLKSAELTMRLALLLFSVKPLEQGLMREVHQIISQRKDICQKLVDSNQRLLSQAQGKLAPHLLSFIGKKPTAVQKEQLTLVCSKFKKSHEQIDPSYNVALIRAVSQDCLLELKILVKILPLDVLNSQMPTTKRTILHAATIQQRFDCIRILSAAGVEVNTRDLLGKTALHYAVEKGNQPIIQFLLAKGASRDLQDIRKRRPEDYSEASQSRISL